MTLSNDSEKIGVTCEHINLQKKAFHRIIYNMRKLINELETGVDDLQYKIHTFRVFKFYRITHRKCFSKKIYFASRDASKDSANYGISMLIRIVERTSGRSFFQSTIFPPSSRSSKWKKQEGRYRYNVKHAMTDPDYSPNFWAGPMTHRKMCIYFCILYIAIKMK